MTYHAVKHDCPFCQCTEPLPLAPMTFARFVRDMEVTNEERQFLTHYLISMRQVATITALKGAGGE